MQLAQSGDIPILGTKGSDARFQRLGFGRLLAVRQQTLRLKLRAATQDLHQLLDQRAGTFTSALSYRQYLISTHAFRSAVEAGLDKSLSSGWSVPSLIPALRSDMEDLEVEPRSVSEKLAITSTAAAGAAMYVLEGSSLGARILLRSAMDNGYSEKFGAKHLAEQVQPERWRKFLLWLEAAELEHDQACRAAREIFAYAVEVYSGGAFVHE